MSLKHLALVGLLLAPSAIAGEGMTVVKHTIDGGGGRSTSGSFTMVGTIGQHDADEEVAGGEFTLRGGFWASGGLAAPTCPSDINGDDVVDVGDLLLVLGQWGTCDGSCSADVNEDGFVDVGDMLALLAEWGPCAP